MSPLSRTPTGIRNMYLFRTGSLIIGVEGPDDVVFWKRIFPEKHGRWKVDIQRVGGIEQLLKVYSDIQGGNTKRTLIVIDSEYDEVLRDKPRHRFVVKTKRHSVENYLCEPSVINKVIADCASVRDSELMVAQTWATEFADTIRELVYADCTAIRLKTGVEVLGKNAQQYLRKDHFTLNKTTIKAKIRQLGFDANDIAVTRASFGTKPVYNLIRGHFLISAVIGFVKNRTLQFNKDKKKFNLKTDELFKDCLNGLFSKGIAIQDLANLRRRAMTSLRLLAASASLAP